MNEVNDRIEMITAISNLSLQLYGWYIQHGHARNDEDRKAVDDLMNNGAIELVKSSKGFYERLYFIILII